MASAVFRWEYTVRLNRVVNYIDGHLDEPLSLRELADVAAFSPYHVHRIFKAMMGETLGGFIWRLRLEKAGNLLLRRPTAPVTEIALACGFSSPSNFSRAFKQRFGVSATRFRAGEQSKLCIAERKPGEGETDLPLYAPGCGHAAIWNSAGRGEMNVDVRTLPSYHVAYVRRFGYSKGVFGEQLHAAFAQVCRWVDARGLFRPETVVIGGPTTVPTSRPTPAAGTTPA